MFTREERVSRLRSSVPRFRRKSMEELCRMAATTPSFLDRMENYLIPVLTALETEAEPQVFSSGCRSIAFFQEEILLREMRVFISLCQGNALREEILVTIISHLWSRFLDKENFIHLSFLDTGIQNITDALRAATTLSNGEASSFLLFWQETLMMYHSMAKAGHGSLKAENSFSFLESPWQDIEPFTRIRCGSLFNKFLSVRQRTAALCADNSSVFQNLNSDPFLSVRIRLTLNDASPSKLRNSILEEIANRTSEASPEQRTDLWLRQRTYLDDGKLSDDIGTPITYSDETEIRKAFALLRDLPSSLLIFLAGDPDSGVKCAVASHPALSHEAQGILARDPDPAVRRRMSRNSNCLLPVLESLAKDNHISVQTLVAQNGACPPHILEQVLCRLAENPDIDARLFAATHVQCPEKVLRAFLNDGSDIVRASLASRDDIPQRPDLVNALSQDNSPDVRYRLLFHALEDESILNQLFSGAGECDLETLAKQTANTWVLKRLLQLDARPIKLKILKNCVLTYELLLDLANDKDDYVRLCALDHPLADLHMLEPLTCDKTAGVRFKALALKEKLSKQ